MQQIDTILEPTGLLSDINQRKIIKVFTLPADKDSYYELPEMHFEAKNLHQQKKACYFEECYLLVSNEVVADILREIHELL